MKFLGRLYKKDTYIHNKNFDVFDLDQLKALKLIQ